MRWITARTASAANAVNADRIRTGLLTDEMVAARSKARGLSETDYMSGNLLKREVTADDVADAFVYLATATKTTAAVITVDGGNIEACIALTGGARLLRSRVVSRVLTYFRTLRATLLPRSQNSSRQVCMLPRRHARLVRAIHDPRIIIRQFAVMYGSIYSIYVARYSIPCIKEFCLMLRHIEHWLTASNQNETVRFWENHSGTISAEP